MPVKCAGGLMANRKVEDIIRINTKIGTTLVKRKISIGLTMETGTTDMKASPDIIWISLTSDHQEIMLSAR